MDVCGDVAAWNSLVEVSMCDHQVFSSQSHTFFSGEDSLIYSGYWAFTVKFHPVSQGNFLVNLKIGQRYWANFANNSHTILLDQNLLAEY